MAELPANLYPAAATVLFSLLCTALGIIGYFLKDIRQQIKDQQKEQDSKIEKVQEEVTTLRESLPQKYVLRDDFIRAIAGLDNKVDNICREVSEISKGLNRLIGGVKE